jgi:hypothetical protein
LLDQTPRRIAIFVTLAATLLMAGSFSVAVAAPEPDPLLGTWKLNIEKSTFHFSVAPRSNVHRYTAFGPDGITATADVVDADGKQIHFTYSIKFDGKFYPVIGDPARDMTSLKRFDTYTGEGANKNNGKVINTSRHELSKDGKTLTVTLKGPKGTDIRVYEKQ